MVRHGRRGRTEMQPMSLLTLKNPMTPLDLTVPYLILVCWARSVTDLMGVLIFFTVRKAARLAV